MVEWYRPWIENCDNIIEFANIHEECFSKSNVSCGRTKYTVRQCLLDDIIDICFLFTSDRSEFNHSENNFYLFIYLCFGCLTPIYL